VIETSTLLLLSVIEVELGPNPDCVDVEEKAVVDSGSDSVVDTAMLVDV
jgi:hypothetical protein